MAVIAESIEQDLQASNQDPFHFQEDSDLPKMYVRDYSIRIDAGTENFCSFIQLEPSHKLSISYKVRILLENKDAFKL